MARGRAKAAAAARAVSPEQAQAAWRTRLEAARAAARDRPPEGVLTRSPEADSSRSARRMVAEGQARRADQLVQAGQGQLVECGRCSSAPARPMRVKHPSAGIWLAVVLCADCVAEGQVQGYVLAAYRP